MLSALVFHFFYQFSVKINEQVTVFAKTTVTKTVNQPFFIFKQSVSNPRTSPNFLKPDACYHRRVCECPRRIADNSKQ